MADDALAAELIAFCRERLAHYMCPRSVDFVAELPRQDNGKIAKVRLREEEALPAVGAQAGTAPRRNFTGTIESVEGETVCLQVDGADLVRLPVAAMEKAHLVFEF